MTYQRPDGETVEFVRPVHEFIAMHGENVLPITLLGLSAGRITHGHRFLSDGDIGILAADYYAVTLETRGKVIPGFQSRKERIRAMLNEKAKGDKVLMPESLLDEVTALVEWPIVYE